MPLIVVCANPGVARSGTAMSAAGIKPLNTLVGLQTEAKSDRTVRSDEVMANDLPFPYASLEQRRRVCRTIELCGFSIGGSVNKLKSYCAATFRNHQPPMSATPFCFPWNPTSPPAADDKRPWGQISYFCFCKTATACSKAAIRAFKARFSAANCWVAPRFMVKSWS